MTWKGHWHGYGPWIGDRTELKDPQRRPGPDPGDQQTRDFLVSTQQPERTGHWLLRRSQAAADRTWTRVEDAMKWLTGIYADRPPFERSDGLTAYLSLDARSKLTQESLALGSDTVWAYYARNGSYISYEVVCCPSSYFHPEISCPLPPPR